MADHPNLLCISLDSVRADEVSFLSASEQTTPVLESLAERSTVYSQAISPTTWTLPAHSSMMTGLYPLEHGVLDFQRELEDIPTLGTELKQEGYDTRAFYRNSWFDVGGMLRGFTVERDSGSSGPDLSGIKGSIARILKRLNVDKPVYELYQYHGRPHEDERTVAAAIDSLESVTKPFGLFVHLNDAHWKYQPPKELEDRFSDVSRPKLRWNQLYWQNRIFENQDRYWAGDWTPREDVSERLRELYRAEIYKVDSLVGMLINALKQRNLLDDTIIAVFGDHGDLFGESGIYGHHFSVADGLIRVPMLVHDPTGQLDPEVIDHPVQLNDLFPTLLRLCGIDPPETRSVDLTRSSRETAFVYYHLLDTSHADELIADTRAGRIPPKRQYAIWRSEDEKATWYPDTDTYDGSEPLFELLVEHYQSLDKSAGTSPHELGTDTRKQLARLGYL